MKAFLGGPYAQIALPLVCVLLALACAFAFVGVAVWPEWARHSMLVLAGTCLGGAIGAGLQAQDRDRELVKELRRQSRVFVDKQFFAGWRKHG